eukprot:2931554-Rhodomonas_salina.2
MCVDPSEPSPALKVVTHAFHAWGRVNHGVSGPYGQQCAPETVLRDRDLCRHVICKMDVAFRQVLVLDTCTSVEDMGVTFQCNIAVAIQVCGLDYESNITLCLLGRV